MLQSLQRVTAGSNCELFFYSQSITDFFSKRYVTLTYLLQVAQSLKSHGKLKNEKECNIDWHHHYSTVYLKKYLMYLSFFLQNLADFSKSSTPFYFTFYEQLPIWKIGPVLVELASTEELHSLQYLRGSNRLVSNISKSKPSCTN